MDENHPWHVLLIQCVLTVIFSLAIAGEAGHDLSCVLTAYKSEKAQFSFSACSV